MAEQEFFSINPSTHIRTTSENRRFYDLLVDEKNIFSTIIEQEGKMVKRLSCCQRYPLAVFRKLCYTLVIILEKEKKPCEN